jgi:hypothetical protein
LILLDFSWILVMNRRESRIYGSCVDGYNHHYLGATIMVTCYILDGNSHHCNKTSLAEMDVRGRKSEVGKKYPSITSLSC